MTIKQFMGLKSKKKYTTKKKKKKMFYNKSYQ